MSDTQRRYLSISGFAELVKSTPKSEKVDAKNLCVLAPMATRTRAIGGENSRIIEFIVSTSRVDRENDTINQQGWDLADYKNNPVVLWVHDNYSPPIARSSSIYLDGDALHSIAEFTPEDMNPFGYQIYRLYQGGFLNACSAGFQPVEYTYDEMRKYGVNFIKQSLLEYSCVPVPANPDALAVARSKGLKTDLLKAWAERALDEHPSTDEARRQLEVLRNLSTSDGRALILEIGGMKMSGSATDKTDPPAPAAPANKDASPTDAVVKKVERWTCAEGHDHMTEDEAKTCGNTEALVTAAVAAIKALDAHVVGRKAITKQGRVLSAANEERLRSALTDMETCATRITEVLDQLPEEEPDEEVDASKSATDTGVFTTVERSDSPEDTQDVGMVIRFADDVDPEAVIAAAVTASVREEINRLTGRVD